MRGFTMVAAVVLTGVAAGMLGPLIAGAQDQGGAVRGRFRDLFRPGDHVLVRTSSEITHLTLVGEEELPGLQPTDEERQEYEALRDERSSSFGAFRREPNESVEEHRRRMEGQMRRARRERESRMSELQRKMRLREIVLAGEDYLGLRDAEGETTYVPHHRIGSVAGSWE